MIGIHEPCLCGATDCPRCYPFSYDRDDEDADEEEIEPDYPPEPTEAELDRDAELGAREYEQRFRG